MPWGRFTFALIVVYVLQTAVVGLFHVKSLDLFLLLALAAGLSTPVHDARLGAWIIGLVQDLGSPLEPLGIHAFALGLTGLIVTGLRELVNLNLAWVRVLVAFPAAFAGALLYLLHLHFWQRVPLESWVTLLGSAAGTALIASAGAALVTAFPRLAGRGRRRGQVGRASR